MARLFEKIRISRPKRNKFDLSAEKKLSFNMGKLIPIFLQEILPGDSFRVNSEIFIRMAPMIAPVMHRVNVFTHYFFVPNRLVWDEWEDFITGGREGTSTPSVPNFNASDVAATATPGSLLDFLGVPTLPSVSNEVAFSALPFRAYSLIWDEYYRDQNLLASIDVSKASGNIPAGAELTKITALRDRAWEKDYFTSALPWAQRGPEVTMPSDAQVTYKTPTIVTSPTPVTPSNPVVVTSPSGNDAFIDGGTGSMIVDNIESVEMQVTINELRRSIKLQEWLEKNARGGARYIEQILSHFGVISSDARLQRPEYLGGGKQPIVISEVTSSAMATDGVDTLPQGNMAGHGVSFGKTNGFKKTFEEHGFVIGMMSVLPRTSYQQGVPKYLSRFDKLDYYWPEFAHLGEQEILNKEIFYNGVGADPEAVWGYQSRYAEYKYGCSMVHGDFKDTLDFWHMGRIFGSLPSLSNEFVTADPTERIFAVEDDVFHLYAQIFNKVDALRPMPYFGTPTI